MDRAMYVKSKVAPGAEATAIRPQANSQLNHSTRATATTTENCRTHRGRTSLNNNLLAMVDASAGDGGARRGVAGEPKLKKRRTEHTHDGPVENEETAREKMEEAGFDPDDVTKQCKLSYRACVAGNTNRTLRAKMHPVTYFCLLGDLKMCRYLLSKGASSTATSTDCTWFPMYSAAAGGRLDVCKWLYGHGAKVDIGRRSTDNYWSNAGHYSPLQAAGPSQACCRWFILKGVLSLDDKPGVVDPERMRRDIRPEYDDYDIIYDVRPQLLEWVKQSVQTHSGFMTFLLGTLPAAVPTFSRAALQSLLAERLQSQNRAEIFIRNAPEEQCRLAWEKISQARVSSPIVCLGGTTGILELIADYAGVFRGRDLRILRSLVGPLSEYLKEVPEGEEGFGIQGGYEYRGDE